MAEITVLDSETLYVKRGRKYVPVYSRRDAWNDSDLMRVGATSMLDQRKAQAALNHGNQ